MLRGMAVLARIQEEANREWQERFDSMTLDEKQAELRREPRDMAFYAAGLNAVMLVGILPMFAYSIFVGYDPWFMAFGSGLTVFMAGAGPIAGLHWGGRVRLAKKYGVYVRTVEDRALDIIFGVMVAFALEVHFSYLNSLEVNLVLLAIGVLVQVILVRWAFFGKGPVKPLFNNIA